MAQAKTEPNQTQKETPKATPKQTKSDATNGTLEASNSKSC